MHKENKFYSRLLKEVENSGKSMNSIERELGYPRNSLHNYKNGTEPSGFRLIEIAQYLKVSPEYLIGKKESETSLSLIHIFNNLSEADKLKMFKISQKWADSRIHYFMGK